MPTTINEIYNQFIRVLPSSERLKLATLILNNLAQQDTAIDDSDTWTEEDISDLSAFSLQYAATIYAEDYCLNQAMDESAVIPLLGREAALAFLAE